MGIAEDFRDHLFNLDCLSKGAAKRRFRRNLKWAFGGLCAYCRSEKATSLDHIRPRSMGGSSLRSNLIPACGHCQHSKANRPDWVEWFKEQEFYSPAAQEAIEDWISNRRFIEEESDGPVFNTGAKVCDEPSPVRGQTYVPQLFGENMPTPA